MQDGAKNKEMMRENIDTHNILLLDLMFDVILDNSSYSLYCAVMLIENQERELTMISLISSKVISNFKVEYDDLK